MEIEYWQRVSRIFNAALEVDSVRRADFVERECAGNRELQAEVRALISAHESFDSFIDSPLGRERNPELVERLQPGERIASFQILSFVGAGGMGEVYLAEDERLGRRVAIKLLPSELKNDKEHRRRFELEARAASKLNHPGIITVYEVGFADERPFIAMEFVDGETLRSRMSDRTLGADETLRIASELANALAAAHRAGILHRDIKPENIMLRREDGLVRILDFGLAKPVRNKTDGSFATADGMVLGTAAYMSPEQAVGKPVDVRSDIWSYGVVLFEMSAGRKPFEGLTPSHTLVNVLDSTPDFTPLPDSLKPIVERCLQKEPDKRYASFDEIVTTLKSLASVSGAVEAAAIQKRGISLLAPLFAGLFLIAAALGVFYYYYNRPAARQFEKVSLSRLTTGGKEKLAAVSPDGTRIAHVTEDSGRQNLILTDTENRTDVEILPASTQTFIGLAFSPNGDKIVYTAAEKENSSGSLYTLDTATRQKQRILDDVDSQVSFSPDGRRFAFFRDEQTKSVSLLISSLDGEGPPEVVAVRLMPDFFIGIPDWSPDGKTIICPAASLSGSVDYKVIAIDVESKKERVLTADRWTTINQVHWNSDSKNFLMTAKRADGEPMQIWQVDASTGTADRVTNDLSDYWTFGQSRGSPSITAVRTEESADIWTAAIPGDGIVTDERLRQITFDGELRAGLGGITQSDDGRIFFTSSIPNREALMFVHENDSEIKQLITTDGAFVFPSVSDDGKHLIHAKKESDGVGLWAYDLTSGLHKKIEPDADSGIQFFPNISPDGSWYVYCATNRSGKLTLRRRLMDGKSDAQILADHNSGLAKISPDGKLIAFNFQRGSESMWRLGVIPAVGGEVHELPVFGNPSTPFDWTGDSKFLVVIQTEKGASNLVKQPIDGSASVLFTSFKSGHVFNLDISPDGKRLALSRGSRKSDLVLIKDETGASTR